MQQVPNEAVMPALRMLQVVNKLRELGASIPQDASGLVKLPS